MTLLKQIQSIRQSVWWLFAVLALCSSAAWSAVGYVHESSGAVFAQRGTTGAEQPIKAGDTFDPGTTFRTAGDGNVIIKFEDGQLAALQPNTTFRVNQYNFIANKPKESTSSISLIGGAMRFVTGVIGATNKNNMKFTAGTTATIGIRGTDLTLQVNAATQAVLAAIAQGAASLETASGSTIVGVGQFATSLGSQAPTASVPISSAPAAVQQLVSTLSKAPIPLNNPVIVASAARAAVAVAQARAAAVAAADPANKDNKAIQEQAKTTAAAATTAVNAAVADATTLVTAVVAAGGNVADPPPLPIDTPALTTTTVVNTPATICNPALVSCN